MLSYNKKYIKRIKKEYKRLKNSPHIADKILSKQLESQINIIKKIKKKFYYPDDYIKNYNFYPEIENIILSGEPFCLLFTGNTGRGKTYLMKIIKDNIVRLYIREFYRYAPKWVDTNRLYKIYLQGGDGRGLSDFVFVDDIGSEQPQTEQTKAYIGDYIRYLYDNHKKNNGRIHGLVLSTNLDSKKLKEYYGDRVFSRLFEIAEVFVFRKENMRKTGKVYK